MGIGGMSSLGGRRDSDLSASGVAGLAVMCIPSKVSLLSHAEAAAWNVSY